MREATYCVYTQRVNGAVFYVGKGTVERPFSSGSRNDIWLHIVRSADVVEIEIIGWYQKEGDAFREEARQIGIHRPKANIRLASRCLDIRKQILLDRDDVRLLATLKKTKRYGSSDGEILRRGLQCLAEQEKSKEK